MRYPFESSSNNENLRSWLSHKNKGKELYERGQYAEALQEYQNAFNPILEAPRQEQQIILSNIVACRLKMGDQAEEAVKEAKQCVALNPAWAKGHVRLASAYMALGGHSNDACNALQTALRLDPGNAMARQMLVRELRRDHAPPPINPDYVPPETLDPIDDSVSITERMQFFVARVSLWYERQSSETKQILKIAGLLLVLYVAFGGRFGLESLYAPSRRGNYERGNIYDQYRQRHQYTPYYDNSHYSQRGTNYGSTNHHGNNNNNNHGYGNVGYSSPDGSSLASLAMILGAAYLCHRNGINPMHAMFMMNMMRRRRGYGMMGGNFGGMRFGRRRW